MNEAIKRFTADLAKEIQAKLEAPEVRDFVAKVKASGEDRTFEVVMSTSDEDRQGDELDQSKWDLKYFNLNPVVLWAHDYSSFPIGIITDIQVQGKKAVATGKFAPAGINPDADMACALYQEKILRAVSPGYIQNDDGTRELLEVSFCPVPAGRYALSMRQVGKLGVSTADLVTKGFFYEKEVEITKSPQAGDSCQTEDGEPGTLTEDGGNPGTLICVPSEAKANKSNEPDADMNNELIKSITAEHTRHGEAVGKSITDFSEKSFDKEGVTPDDSTKAIDEFTKAIDGEQDTHLEKCMKAIDDNYELQDQKKSLDEFKKAIEDEHMNHVKNVDKSIVEFKDAWADGDDSDRAKAIDDFTKSMGDELTRHKEAHMEMCKTEMDGGETDEQKTGEEAAAPTDSIEAETKSGRAISAANQEKIKAIIKAIEDHHKALVAEHEKSTTTAIASLKELMGSPQDDEGQETKAEAEAAIEAPKPKVESSKTQKKDEHPSDFELFMLSRKVLKAVYQAAGEGLEVANKVARDKYPNRR